MRSIRGLLIALFLGGCATSPSDRVEPAWIPDQSWWDSAMRFGGTVLGSDGSSRFVPARHAKNLYEANRRIRAQSSIPANLAIIASDDLNAFASKSGGQRIVTITLALLEGIGDDPDALATIIGHEVAHLHYAHGEARNERNAPAQAITYVLGTIVEGIPIGGAAGKISVNTTFSRYEEREADIKGMEWAIGAGFSPCGFARTMRILRALDGSYGSSSWLSTHPGHDERIARALIMAQRAPSHLLMERLC